ncbi:unnamed protein product [Onchocerca ochengi]|uniref:COMM domain-containing protein n=1 Tax=Onchocerca ochengi TaxID=42157 RepID=A0A182E7R6_ONCOC|nr:unnamed protein product [Onchocerca ochengi]
MKLLPDGVEGIVEKITQLGSTKFIQISQHLLERIPDIVDFADVLNVEERERLLGSLQTDPASELAVFLTISELWKNIAYYQPKLQPLLESLKEAGFDAEMRSTIVKIWSESGLTVSDRLRNISFSGRSNVRDVGWTLRKNVARDLAAFVTPLGTDITEDADIARIDVDARIVYTNVEKTVRIDSPNVAAHTDDNDPRCRSKTLPLDTDIVDIEARR